GASTTTTRFSPWERGTSCARKPAPKEARPMTADQVMAHFQENWRIYAGVGVILAPILFWFRKWSVPVLLWTFESLVYMVLFHIIVHYLVAIINWFKFESQMKMLVDDKVN